MTDTEVTATTVLYPSGYGTLMETLEQLEARHSPHMHPEYQRRLFTWLQAQAGLVGIGGGYRAPGQQPDGPTFAPEGKSFHQDQQFASGFIGYCAVDLVVAVPGLAHRAPYWSEVPHQGSSWAVSCGLHANIAGEPWHLQPVEIDGYQSWLNAGRPDPVAGYPIPGNPPTPVPQPPEVVLKDMPTLHKGDTGNAVVVWQSMLIQRGIWTDKPANRDGIFGDGTEAGTKKFQESRGLVVDGIPGPKSWAAIGHA